ncbi:DUF6301 family protein [Rhodococcus sp. SGAir0479]|uniref:DUF6301 family protein n=1 Tax=Rhodococcus sp. SGAir0479 TaxID=2567884 RepID=UPI0010CD6840|nr:DUF6301 family protein [Rhodococcus sp. SGAir0479]QCQ92947.1 hypothetical protein E7742_18115 [Rhodococcus sp. SGAir0479]
MRTDFDRAAEIVRLAAEFEWTWSRDDLDRFCAAAGWTVTEYRELGASITTGLNIARPGGTANLDVNSVKKIDFGVTDSLGEQEAESSGLLGVWFTGLCSRLLTELGLPTRREEGRMRWDLPTVVVTAFRGERKDFVSIASPQYEAEQDQIDEYIDKWDEYFGSSSDEEV